MNSTNLSPDGPGYDATEDTMAPYSLSLLYESEYPLDDILPSSVFAPGGLGDLSLFPDFLPIQDPAVWVAEQIDYPWEQQLADRYRLVESTQPLEEYTWEEGHQAIDDFDWSTPEDGLDLTAASPLLSTEATATNEGEQRVEHPEASGNQFPVHIEEVPTSSSQDEDERPEKRQKLETQSLSTEIPVSPPWIASPSKAPTQDSISAPKTVPANLELVATNGGEDTDAIIQPEATHSAVVVETESSPTKTASPVDVRNLLDLSAVHENVEQEIDSQPWDSQLQAAVHEGSTNSAHEILPAVIGGAEGFEQEEQQMRPLSKGSERADVDHKLAMPPKISDQRRPPLDEHLYAGTTILPSIATASKPSAKTPSNSAHEKVEAGDTPILISMAEGILKRESTPESKEQAPVKEESKKSSTSKSKATSRKSLKTSSTTSPATLPKRPKASKSPRQSPRGRFSETSDGTTQYDTDKLASAEIYFEEDTRPEPSPADVRTRREDTQARPNDDDYDAQERLTDTSETKAYQRPPRNTVSNRELAALGSTFTPGMHLGLHHGQPKRARKSNETRYSESSSDVEITSVKKKQRTAPATDKKRKKTNLGAQRTQGEIELSEEEHNNFFPEPRYAVKGGGRSAKKRADASERSSEANTSDVEERPRAKRNSLLKNALTPSAPVKNKFGFSPRKTTPAAKGSVKGKTKGKKADNAAEESTNTPLTRRKSQQLEQESARLEKDANIAKRLRSKG